MGRALPAGTLVFDERRGIHGRPLASVRAGAASADQPGAAGPNMLAQLRRAGVEIDRDDILVQNMRDRHPQREPGGPAAALANMRRMLAGEPR